jgi:hypothetical protein
MHTKRSVPTRPNHALQRTRHGVVVCNRAVPRARSLRKPGLMRIATYNCALLIAAVVMTGCLREIHYTSAPGVSGRVLDSDGHSPIPDAIVTLIPEEIGPYSDKIVSIKVRTSRRGVFHIPQQRDWLVYDKRSPAALFGLCAPALLRVQHRGYELFETNIAIGDFKANTIIDDFKTTDICLKRVPK